MEIIEMDFGWIISGPGSTWVDEDFRLVRNFKAAGVFDDPAEALKILNARHKGIKWKLHKLTAELVCYSGQDAWLPY